MEEYYEIRKALIALLCVGDPINCIHSIPSYGVITKYTVSQLIDNDLIQLRLAGGNLYVQSISFIYAYEGQLYIWNGDKIFNYNHETRLAIVIDVINSPKTVFKDETRRR